MRKLILEEWISLDGFAEDQNGKLDFFPSTEQNKYADEKQLEFLETVDTMILGRKTYELFAEFWPFTTADKEIIADKLNSLNKIVFSKTLEKAPWGKFPDATIIAGDASEEIRGLKAQEGKDLVLWGSISLAQALMKEDLVDEYKLSVCPVLVGGGKSLFPGMEGYTNLEMVERVEYESGVVMGRYVRWVGLPTPEGE